MCRFRIRICAFAVSSFLLVSCVSIPNENKTRQENVSIEYTALADGYYEQKNYKKAIEYYKKALVSAANYDVVAYKLACSYALSSRWTDALDLYTELAQKDAANRTLQESIAYVTVMSGDFSGGVALYEQLVASYPEDGKLLKNYMLTLIAAGNEEDAQYQLSLYKARFGEDDTVDLIATKLSGEDTQQQPKDAETDSDAPSEVAPVKESPAPKTEKTAPAPAPSDKEDFIIPDWTEE